LINGLKSALGALALLVVLGCGGGGDPFDGGTVTVFASDLVLFSDSSSDSGIAELRVGDTATDLGMRIGVRFIIEESANPLAPIFPSGDIASAVLRMRQTGVVGNPYAALGFISVDRVDFGVALLSGDYDPPVLTPDVGTLSDDAALGILELDVTAAVLAAKAAGSLTSDLLLRFAGSSANQIAEYAQFERATGNGDGPVLLLTYR
jgi:hypothetical protein